MRKPQLFAPENHPARSICGIKLAHKKVQNEQLKQWMQCEFFLGIQCLLILRELA